ncbi:MAG: adenylate/guanylate cyclase domain-containing protein [Spirochaetaceae bacterium]|nr:MAG: adenylate/guanylate cyclase domain-containing protein [Spirochaetaceae bacterium]
MKIRSKVALVVIPILVATVVMVGVFSYFNATTGITRVARELLDFRTQELDRFARGQWQILVENDFANDPEMVAATELSIARQARGMLRSETQAVLAFDQSGRMVLSTSEAVPADPPTLPVELLDASTRDLTNIVVNGVDRVAMGFFFAPFGWYILHTEQTGVFYQDVDRIGTQTLIILASSLVIAVILLFIFAGSLTRPLGRIVKSMRKIIESNDLSERVAVEFNDETGELAHTFNIMIGELDRAYTQIKSYALQAVVAQKKEQKIRNIFQKYVPQELIDRFFANPESMLVGENRQLSILFSDIRSFTSISEQMTPDALVQSLNDYFSVMVDLIMNRGGIIDKYIGDAIMAFFGAPVRHDDDAYQSLMAALDMCRELDAFNDRQRSRSRPEFKIGVGLAYGLVTVGNIGTEKKMDYTVIGDMVNLASRMEGLTKYYKQQVLFSETLHAEVGDTLPTRLIDKVAVKGKTQGVRIYTAASSLSNPHRRLWKIHNEGMEDFFARRFSEAVTKFKQALVIDPDDYAAAQMLARAETFRDTPPPADWTGVEVMQTK